MANIIIQNRLKKLTTTKRHLLTLKKKDRGNGLKETNETIGRLKRWQRELDEKEQLKLKEQKPIIFDRWDKKKKKKQPKKVKEGIKKMKQSMQRACKVINNQIDNDFVNVSKLEDYEVEFITDLKKRGENHLKS